MPGSAHRWDDDADTYPGANEPIGPRVTLVPDVAEPGDCYERYAEGHRPGPPAGSLRRVRACYWSATQCCLDEWAIAHLARGARMTKFELRRTPHAEQRHVGITMRNCRRLQVPVNDP